MQFSKQFVLWHHVPLFVLSLAAASVANGQVAFDWATIGDTGNAADTLVMTKCPSTFCTGDGSTGYGSVDYEYEIAKQHVTASQYTEFLNSVDPNGTNDLFLFDPRMETFFHPVSFLPLEAYSGNILFDDSAAAGSKYTAKSGRENFPATWVSWVGAARFVNWLSNGQGSGDTESGVYNNLPASSNDPIPEREEGATIFLPTDDEFYKAAYYNPTLNGGSGGYTEYGVGNTAPVVEGPAGGPTSANYAQTDGVDGQSGDTYWQSGGGAFDDDLVHLTEVGAYTTATSHYGLFDVDGNAYQWLEATRPNQFNTSQDLPIFRGGSWFNASDGSGAAYRNTQFFAAVASGGGLPSLSSNNHSFRIARLVQVEVLEGDYNGDGTVDAADYTVWRDNLGLSDAALNGNGTGDASGLVVQADYTLWVSNFGQSAASTATSVPEPASLALLCLGVFGVFFRSKR